MITNKFKENGLRYDIVYLQKIFPQIIFWDTKKQSGFADLKTVTNPDNLSPVDFAVYIDMAFETDASKGVFMRSIDSVVIGNLAFIALKSKHEETRSYALAVIDDIKDWFETNALSDEYTKDPGTYNKNEKNTVTTPQKPSAGNQIR